MRLSNLAPYYVDIPISLENSNIKMWQFYHILVRQPLSYSDVNNLIYSPIAGPRSNPYCEYHWWFTNVLLSCPWAGGLFRLLMASSFTWRKLFIVVVSCSIWILTAWGLGGGPWKRSWCRCCFWSSPPPPLPPSSPSRPWSSPSRWWWRQGWGGTGGGSLTPGWIRKDCQHPHRGTCNSKYTLLINNFPFFNLPFIHSIFFSWFLSSRFISLWLSPYAFS